MSSKRRRKKARVPGLIITIILLLLVAEFVGLLAITKLLPVYLLFAVGIVFMTCVLLVAMLTGNFRKKVRFIIGAILGVLLLAILLLGNLYVMSTYNTLNMSLRHVARHAGLSFNPTIHCARHTFATTVTLTQGVPLETVSKMLGHKRITTTQIYAKITNDKIGQDMAALSEKLSSVFKVAR